MSSQILVTRSSMPPLEEFIEEITPLWESHWLTNMGIKHKEFEQALKEKLGINNLALFTNGHNALECILEALDLHGEVITTPFTFASTTHAIVRKGLAPVFADIREDDLTLDPVCIEKMVTPNTCAILPVHVYGNLCDVDAIQNIADKYGLKVIYDAAHAFGVERRNGSTGEWESAAAYGDASMFSFHATKVFNTIEGGCVSFKDSRLYDLLNQWKNFGITGPESVEYVGTNAKMNEFCAAMGLCNLRHLNEEIARRKVVSEAYWNYLGDISGITLIKPDRNIHYNYAYLPILIDPERFGMTRDDLFARLESEGICARKYFYPLVSDFKCYNSIYSSERTPIAKRAAAQVLTLPLHADLDLKTVGFICRTIVSCKC